MNNGVYEKVLAFKKRYPGTIAWRLKAHSKVVENLLDLMSEKAISLNERIEVLSQRTIEDKLISCLSIIEEKTPKGKTSQIPFSTTFLSDYLCVNRSALQREITRLKNAGIVTISKRKFKLIRKHDSFD